MKPIVIKETDTRTGEERVHAFERAPVSLGRGKHADIRLDAHHVSDLHASFLEERGVLVFTDHDSRNGSVVDNVQVDGRTVPVTESSRIRIGDFSLSVSRVLPPGVKAKKASTAARDVTTGVAAPPTDILSRTTLEAIRRHGAPAPAPAPAPLRLEDPVPVSSEISARPSFAAVPLPASPSVEIDQALIDPPPAQSLQGAKAGQTKTLLAGDLPGLASALESAQSKAASAREPPRKGSALTATPFPGAAHPWFDEDGERNAEPDAVPSPSLKKTAGRLVVVAMFGLVVGIVGGVVLHSAVQGRRPVAPDRSSR